MGRPANGDSADACSKMIFSEPIPQNYIGESHVAGRITAFPIGSGMVAHSLPRGTGLFQHSGLSPFDGNPSCGDRGTGCGALCRTCHVVYRIACLVLCGCPVAARHRRHGTPGAARTGLARQATHLIPAFFCRHGLRRHTKRVGCRRLRTSASQSSVSPIRAAVRRSPLPSGTVV